MKIYIVHESGGEYEDKWDNILGVFTTLEKAQELRDRKKKENDEYSEKESGLSEEEYESYCEWVFDDYVNYYITQITLDKEEREKGVEE